MDINPEILDCNVRGLNDPAKRHAVRDFVASLHVNIVCFQETKLDVIDEFLVLQCLGPSFDGFVYLPAIETRGGVLLAWDTSVIEISNFSFDTFAVTGEVITKDNKRWWITNVYGPQRTEEKILFLTELTERRALCPGPWLLLGDFNMIMYASEKNNENLDRQMMTRFRRFAQLLELKDLYMHGRQFTWSNGRDTPTLTRIDWALVSVDWDLQNPDALLQALPSSLSDHAPLHISLSASFRPKKRFRFELFWLKLEGVDEAIKEAWVCDQALTDPFRRLDALFRNSAEALQSWGQKKIGNLKLNLAIANTIILRLDIAQESRTLSRESCGFIVRLNIPSLAWLP
jgi:exonuclease III